MKKNANHLLSSRQSLLWIGLLASITVMAAGCGKQAFVATGSQAAQNAPGSFAVAPKVDVLVVQDDTGSSHPVYNGIASQLNTFLTNLQNQGWDYHLATVPLTSYRSISQVMASQYDPNWGSQWKPPYPGAQSSNVPKVPSAYFRLPSVYSDFLGSGYQGATNANEPALKNIRNMLNDPSVVNSGFLRDDAILAIVLLSTGDDTSERNMCTTANGHASSSGQDNACDLIGVDQNGGQPRIACGQSGANNSPYCNNYESSLTPYKAFFEYYKGSGNKDQIRLYSVVATQHYASGSACLGGTNAFLGQRYLDMSSFLAGQSYDICTQPIPNVLNGIAANLETIQLDLYTSYLFMEQEPDPSTITVYLNPGGDVSRAVQMPQSAYNGWTFAGNVSNVYTTAIGDRSATPTLNIGSGWAVKLNGNGMIRGSDTATVTFKPAGLQNSSQ
jgi:hypothetical protein